jgi:hypothetical protein
MIFKKLSIPNSEKTCELLYELDLGIHEKYSFIDQPTFLDISDPDSNNEAKRYLFVHLVFGTLCIDDDSGNARILKATMMTIVGLRNRLLLVFKSWS